MNAHAVVWLSELEQKLLETNSALDGHPFPIDHLFNIVAQYCPGPFSETEAVQVAPLLARVLSVGQLEFLLQEARHLCHEAADNVAGAALHLTGQRTAEMNENQKNQTPAMRIAAPPDWSYRYSLAPQGALLLALMWAVLPPGDLPEPVA